MIGDGVNIVWFIVDVLDISTDYKPINYDLNIICKQQHLPLYSSVSLAIFLSPTLSSLIVHIPIDRKSIKRYQGSS